MLINGDSLIELAKLSDNSVDLIVTDPPYGYSFMGKEWDKALPDKRIWKECLRVLKAGGFAYVMSAPRQDVLSRMMIDLEDVGFKTDFTSMYWAYASGFPKALNVSKVVDKKLGVERKVIGRNPNSRENCDKTNTVYESGTVGKTDYITESTSEKAKKLDGSYAGFQPKPAVEVIIVCMKPLEEKGYVDQAMKNGKGVSWFDDCRIPYESDSDKELCHYNAKGMDRLKKGYGEKLETSFKGGWEKKTPELNNQGRYPANLLVSDNAVDTNYGDSGDFSRYFDIDKWYESQFIITPKASKSEKNKGLDKNNHPTVKPLKLMSYLITLGSREGDVVLDPFMGSGTTPLASKNLGRNYIGIEREEEYFKICCARVGDKPTVLDSVKGVEKERGFEVI